MRRGEGGEGWSEGEGEGGRGGIGWMGLVALECFWNTLYHGHYFDENYQIEFLGWFYYYQTG